MTGKKRVFLVKLFHLMRLKPLSLAEKCRLQFGAAVFFILCLALFIPYLWMRKLTEKASLDAGRSVAQTVYERHFQLNEVSDKGLAALEESGAVRDSIAAAPMVRSDERREEKAKNGKDATGEAGAPSTERFLKPRNPFDNVPVFRGQIAAGSEAYINRASITDGAAYTATLLKEALERTFSDHVILEQVLFHLPDFTRLTILFL